MGWDVLAEKGRGRNALGRSRARLDRRMESCRRMRVFGKLLAKLA